MNYCKLYKRLDSEERHVWYDDFRTYFLRSKKIHPNFRDKPSSDMLKLFSDYIELNTEVKNSDILRFGKSRIMRPEMYSVDLKVMIELYLKEQFERRKEWIIEYYPEVLI